MVLFDEDPVTVRLPQRKHLCDTQLTTTQLIRQTTRNFHTDSDLQSISRIHSSLSTLRSARSLRLNAQHTQLAQLTRKAQHLRATHDSETSRHDPAAHASDILALDTEKFRVAKAANELEIEAERLGSEVYTLKKQLQRLDEQGDELESVENKAEDEVV
jgi:kinetochore protein Spc24